MPEAKWDGKGRPPTKAAATAWLIKQGVSENEAKRLAQVTPTETLGDAAREAARFAKRPYGKDDYRSRGDGPWDGKGDIKGYPGRARAVEWVMRETGMTKEEAARRVDAAGDTGLSVAAAARAVVSGKGPAPKPQKATPTKTATPQDSNDGGVIDAREKAAAEAAAGTPTDDEIDTTYTGGTVDTRGAPLLPYDESMDPEVLAGLTFKNQSKSGWHTRSTKDFLDQQRVGPRYYDRDTLAPVNQSWSAEKTAALQDAMYSIGLYGKNGMYQRGTWTGADQKAYKHLLTYANVDGRTWQAQLVEWKRRPPLNLLADLGKEDGETRPTIVITNPLDIQATAEGVSQSLTGEVDRGFVESAVPAFQGQQVSTQERGNAADAAGQGETVTNAASMEAFLADKMRREQPLEVDGYSFVNAFDSFIDMIGAR